MSTPKSQPKIALVHDYIKEFGGAERVLRVLADMYPNAPIYTAFITPNSTASKIFSDRKLIPWKHQWLINKHNLHSPFRFLIPLIWESFDFSDYDVVISSASGYITKSIITRPETFHICYCHTPPRFLYGYPTAREWQRYWPIRICFQIVSHFLRQYDFLSAQRVDLFIANSKNIQQRIKKFYRRNSKIIYPPVETNQTETKNRETKNYFLVVSRIVGAKGWNLLFDAVKKINIKVKIVGESSGLKRNEKQWRRASGKNVEWLGRVSDQELNKLYQNAKALLALAYDEDFGITPVEAMSTGTPVIAYAGGGYLETVVEGKTGTFFNEYTSESLIKAILKFNPSQYKPSDCFSQARKFSKQNFQKQIRKLVIDEWDKLKSN